MVLNQHWLKIQRKVKHLVAHKLLRKPLPEVAWVRSRLKDCVGVEFGGPSEIFRIQGQWPIYDLLSSITIVNFSQNNLWSQGKHSQFLSGGHVRYLFADREDPFYYNPTLKFHALLASHVIEHLANPIKYLKAWKKLMLPGSTFVFILPDPQFTFDHRRQITPIEHFFEDDRKNISEADLTHVDEVLRLHDLKLDPGAGNFQDFKLRCLDNFKNRGLHHHVFNEENTTELLKRCGYQVEGFVKAYPFHLIFWGEVK